MSDIQTVLERGLADVQKQVEAKHAEMQAKFIELAQKGDNAFSTHTPAQKSVTAQLLESPQLKALRERTAKHISIPLDGVSLKAIVSDAGSSNDSPYPTQAQRDNRFGEDARRRLTLLDVAPRLAVGTGSFEFVQLDSYTNAAGIQVAQGDLKAEQSTEFELAVANIATVAVTQAISQQAMADNPALAAFLQSRMMFNVLEKLERELIAGPGGSGQISGLLNQALQFVPSSSNAAGADAIGEAQAALTVDGWNAGLVILHPRDWQTIRSERAQGGEYVAGGWDQPSAPNIWGVPVIANAALTQGTALVLDPAQMVVLDRQQPAFELGYVDRQFAENMLTCRAEARAGLAVFSPSAVLKVDL